MTTQFRIDPAPRAIGRREHVARVGRQARATLLTLASVWTAVFAAGCGQPSAAQSKGKRATGDAAATEVVAVKPERETIRRVTSGPGQIVAFEETPLFAKVSGYVRTLHVDMGDRVEKDQVLAEIWVPELEDERTQKRALVAQAEADRAQAEAAVEAARAAVGTARAKVIEAGAAVKRAAADYESAKSELSRIERLAGTQAINEKVVEEMRNKFRAADAARDETAAKVESAEAGVKESEAKLDKARADTQAAAARIAVADAERQRIETLLQYTKIYSPFDGVVFQRAVDTGHFIPATGTSKPLFVVMRTDPVRVFVDVREQDASAIKRGNQARVHVQALGGQEFDGSVTRASWALDETSRTLRAEIDVPNPDGTLRPRMYAYGTIVLDEHPDALVVPTTAVAAEGDTKYCSCVVNGKIARKTVTVGLDDGTHAEILSGLTENDTVVKANAASFKDGQAVQIAAAQ